MHAERGPGAGRAVVEVDPHSCLHVEEGGHGAVVEQLLLAVGEAPAAAEQSFRLDPELVQVGARPGLRVVAELMAAAPVPAVLGLVEQNMGENRVVHHRLLAADILERCDAQAVRRAGRGRLGEGGHGRREDRHGEAAHQTTSTTRNMPISMW